MPAYNASTTIRCALDSIRRQSFQNWECIVVDDGSTDSTVEQTREFVRVDQRFRLLLCEHRGIVGALNAGLDRCTADVVARMDADDVMHRNRLGLQWASLRADPKVCGVGSWVRLFPRSSLGPGLLAYEAWLNQLVHAEDVERDAFIECPLSHPSLMLNRAVLERYRYRALGWPEDYDLVLRLLTAGLRLKVVPKRLLGWRHREASLTRVGADYTIDRFVAVKAEFVAKRYLAHTKQYVLWGYGKTGRALCKGLRALGKVPSHIVEVHPGRIGQRIASAPVISPEELCHVSVRPILASVAGAGPRGEVRAALARLGLFELQDFVCTA